MTTHVVPTLEQGRECVVCTVSTLSCSIVGPTRAVGQVDGLEGLIPYLAVGIISIHPPTFTRRAADQPEVTRLGPPLITRSSPSSYWAGGPPAACLGMADHEETASLSSPIGKAVQVLVPGRLGRIHDGRGAYSITHA